MTAKALEPSQVIRLPMNALKEVFDENPDMLVRVVQIIMIRLQRVIFTALRNYLGLYSELVQMKPPHKDKRPAVPPPQMPASNLKTSPTHHKRRPSFDVNISHTLSVEPHDFARPDMLNDLSEVCNSFLDFEKYVELIQLKFMCFRFHIKNTIVDSR